MLKFFKKGSVLLMLTCVSGLSQAQLKPLTDDQYFKGDFKSILKPLPVATKWVDDSHYLLIRDGKTWVVDAKSGKETEQSANPVTAPLSTSAYIKSNDIYIKKGSEDIQLTNDKDKEINPTMSPDGHYVAYTKNNNLYTIDIETKKENRLTNDGSELILNGYASWVYMEEILGRGSRYRAFWWSPDSKNIAFFRSDDTNVPLFTITDGTGQHGYLETVRYPKVGDKNPEVKVGVVSPAGGNIVWADFNQKDDQYFGLPYWKPDGKSLLVQWMNRKQDQLKIWAVDPSTGNKTIFYTEEQKTWIELGDEGSRIHFLENGKGFILFSDKSGWNHMYYYDMNGKLNNQVTAGNYFVTELKYIDEKKGIVYFTAKNKETSTRTDFYSIRLNGKDLKRLSFGEFNHTNINISPNGSYFITTYNNATSPSKMTLVDTKGKLIKDLGDSKGVEFENYEFAKTQIIRVKSDDGLYDLPMKITWPVNMDKNKKYPVLVSIYGGPGRNDVTDSWTLTGSQQWYAKEGLIQVTMDHRGSNHFGKEGMNNLYHNLGYWEMKDYSTLIKWLENNGNADPARIGIVGFSYGGYLSAYALTYGADVFTYGMAGGTVSDWSLYDSHYTERYMGTLADNAEGYKKSSVLTYVDKYKGMLQLVHGVIDENVHLQNTLQLVNELEEKKKDFEMMLYPGGRHGWGGNKGAHFQNLKTKFIYRYLMERPVPKKLLR